MTGPVSTQAMSIAPPPKSLLNAMASFAQLQLLLNFIGPLPETMSNIKAFVSYVSGGVGQLVGAVAIRDWNFIRCHSLDHCALMEFQTQKEAIAREGPAMSAYIREWAKTNSAQAAMATRMMEGILYCLSDIEVYTNGNNDFFQAVMDALIETSGMVNLRSGQTAGSGWRTTHHPMWWWLSISHYEKGWKKYVGRLLQTVSLTLHARLINQLLCPLARCLWTTSRGAKFHLAGAVQAPWCYRQLVEVLCKYLYLSMLV